MRFIILNSSIDDTLLEMYGGITNLIVVIVGAIIIASICIYYLIKEFERGGIKSGSPQHAV